MPRLHRRFLEDERGATAVEYGLLVALLSMVIVTAVSRLGNQLYNIVSSITPVLH